MNILDITVLCRVVDNFGDIGVVYRLLKALSEKNNSFKINLRLVIDNLQSFKNICPEIDENKEIQTFNNWKIFLWNSENCLDEFKKNPPHIILECFQCGRPDWLDKLLFEIKIPNICQIIMIDYLTAEPYAETFHKLLSLTRSSRVPKVNFMPGFTPKTGGLIISGEEFEFIKNQNNLQKTQSKISIFFFSYKKNLNPVLNAFEKFRKSKNINLNVSLARGIGFESFLNAFYSVEDKNQRKVFNLQKLDFIPQEKWDKLLFENDILFIRGEDSLSRACLYGKPFVWNAYEQSENYQLVKVKALLEVMKPHFTEYLFKIVENLWISYNSTGENLENYTFDFLQNYENLKTCFMNFSESLVKNGNLAENLLNFISELKIYPKV